MNKSFLFGWLCGFLPALVVLIIVTIFVFSSANEVEDDMINYLHDTWVEVAIQNGYGIDLGECTWEAIEKPHRDNLFNIFVWTDTQNRTAISEWLDENLTQKDWDECNVID